MICHCSPISVPPHQSMYASNSTTEPRTTTTTTTACVYLGRQIALPMMGSYTWFSYLIFLVFSLVVLLLFLGWSGCCQICHLSCIPVHVSRTCSCDSTVSVHLRHLVSLCNELRVLWPVPHEILSVFTRLPIIS